MATRAQLGDRRDYLRFHRGQFWASLGRVEQVVVRNVSLSGALVEGPAGLQDMRIAHVALPDHGPVVDAVVRHTSPATNELQEDRFLVGLEFVNLSEAARASLTRMVSDGQNAPGEEPFR